MFLGAWIRGGLYSEGILCQYLLIMTSKTIIVLIAIT